MLRLYFYFISFSLREHKSQINEGKKNVQNFLSLDQHVIKQVKYSFVRDMFHMYFISSSL